MPAEYAKVTAGTAPFVWEVNGKQGISPILLPAAMSHAIGSETQRPIAVVVVAGTVSAAFVSLVGLTVFYAAMCRLRALLTDAREKPAPAAMRPETGS